MPAASGSSLPSTFFPSRRRRTSTSRRGIRQSRRSRRRAPERLALIHFGLADDVTGHLERLGAELDRWAGLVGTGMDVDEFVDQARVGAGENARLYDAVAPYSQSWQGLRRYWAKKGS